MAQTPESRVNVVCRSCLSKVTFASEVRLLDFTVKVALSCSPPVLPARACPVGTTVKIFCTHIMALGGTLARFSPRRVGEPDNQD